MSTLFPISHAQSLSGAEIGRAAQGLIDRARRRVWVSQFITTTETSRGPVWDHLEALARASAAGVDVRVLHDRFQSGEHQVSVNEPVHRWLGRAGIETRFAEPKYRSSTHAKLLIVDDSVLTSSANWTDGGRRNNLEVGVLIDSVDYSASSAERFLFHWHASPNNETETTWPE